MLRPDLPTGVYGWQIIDATPQEISEGIVLSVFRVNFYELIVLARLHLSLVWSHVSTGVVSRYYEKNLAAPVPHRTLVQVVKLTQE